VTFVADDHPDARAEYLGAVAYYDRLRAGLGDQLIDRLEEAIEDILSSPRTWPRMPNWDGEPVLRSHVVKVFRYRVIYYVHGDQVRIIAYAHTSRMPGYWRPRVEEAQGEPSPPG
jgi:toxin ParE1/3/4